MSSIPMIYNLYWKTNTKTIKLNYSVIKLLLHIFDGYVCFDRLPIYRPQSVKLLKSYSHKSN